MSKPSNKKKIPFESNYKSLNRDFSDIGMIVENYIKKLTNRGFSIFKSSISSKIIVASGNAHLNGYDEKVYECYVQLINYYRVVMNIFEQDGKFLENVKLKNILDGIYSVLSSRVKLAGETNLNLDTNPITIEKRVIIGKSTNYFMKGFDGTQNEFLTNNLEEAIDELKFLLLGPSEHAQSVNLCNELIKNVEKNCFMDFYDIYAGSIQICVGGLNDIEKRKETYYYFEILRKEEEILSSIVKIQIEALEKEIYGNYVTEQERELVNKILESLKESYQYFAKDASEILNFFDKAPKSNIAHTIEDFENFSLDLRSQINLKDFLTLEAFEESGQKIHENFLNIKNNIKIIFEGLYLKEITKYNSKKDIIDYQKGLTQTLAFTDEMVDVFLQIHQYFLENVDRLMESENKLIINGIDETIVIKIESIDENKNKLQNEYKENIEKFANKNIEYLEEDKNFILNKAHNLAMNKILESFTRGKNIRNIKNILEDCFYQCFEEEVKQKFVKMKEKQKDTLHKIISSYKKDVLLYEMSTFEEIVNYSISKLKESDDDITLEYVEVFEKYFYMLNNILNENGIIIIEPKAHDMFNGKEHDVLMVEKNDLFSKGEIIKLMNCGYRENEIVLIRANVIAAK